MLRNPKKMGDNKAPAAIRLSFVLVTLVFASCTRDNLSPQDSEFVRRHQQFQHDYCSTNIVVADEGLAAFRAWVLDPKNSFEALNRDSVLFEVDARLFLIKERLGETNAAERFYRESVEARDRYHAYIQSSRLRTRLQPITSKDQLREEVGHQDKHFDVGWKTTSTIQK